MAEEDRRVVVASRNLHKVQEIAALLEGLGLTLVGIDDVRPGLQLVEDEDTFEGNALAKASQAAAATGLPALGDDSGLEVDALALMPGVRSARYAGEPSDDGRNNAKLLAALEGVPVARRGARFRCAAAFVDPVQGIELVRSGSCEGHILEVPQGTGGFGYDPLFWVEDARCAMAELTMDEKNRISHRAAAFRALAEVLAVHLS